MRLSARSHRASEIAFKFAAGQPVVAYGAACSLQLISAAVVMASTAHEPLINRPGSTCLTDPSVPYSMNGCITVGVSKLPE